MTKRTLRNSHRTRDDPTVLLECLRLRVVENHTNVPNRSHLLLGRIVSTLLVVTGLVGSLVLPGCHGGARQMHRARRPAESIRALWVTRWDYHTASDIARIMENCRTAGFNTVLFQVRGNGTVFYRSRIEPWADELGSRDPGFDPLAVACRQAHRRGLSLHAWVNVMPGWRGDKPPTNRRQLYWTHPDWFWHDAAGRRQPLGWYNSLNPCYPEVRKYLVSVMREMVARYPIDGLHLDYIRFPNEWHKSYGLGHRVPDYPRDPRTVALFKRATHHTPQSSPAQWDQWRTDKVTQLVRAIHHMVKTTRSDVQLSAAVGASPEDAKRRHFQDSRRWIAEGLLDAVYPMNYTRKMTTFVQWLQDWSTVRSRIPVVTGIMLDRRDVGTAMEQIARAVSGGRHVAAFAYHSLFERVDRHGRPMTDRQSGARAAMRQQVTRYLHQLVAPRA